MVSIGGKRRIWSWKSSDEPSRCLAADVACEYPWALSFPVVEASLNRLPAANPVVSGGQPRQSDAGGHALAG